MYNHIYFISFWLKPRKLPCIYCVIILYFCFYFLISDWNFSLRNRSKSAQRYIIKRNYQTKLSYFLWNTTVWVPHLLFFHISYSLVFTGSYFITRVSKSLTHSFVYFFMCVAWLTNKTPPYPRKFGKKSSKNVVWVWFICMSFRWSPKWLIIKIQEVPFFFLGHNLFSSS